MPTTGYRYLVMLTIDLTYDENARYLANGDRCDLMIEWLTMREDDRARIESEKQDVLDWCYLVDSDHGFLGPEAFAPGWNTAVITCAVLASRYDPLFLRQATLDLTPGFRIASIYLGEWQIPEDYEEGDAFNPEIAHLYT